MVAAAIMALAIATSVTTMQRAFLALDSSRNTTIAAQIMQTELERIRMKDWSTVDAYPTGSAGLTTMTIDSSFTSNPAIGSRFTLKRQVDLVHTDMKKITFTITWSGYDGRTITRSLQTYYGKNGLYDYFYNSY